LGGDKRGEISFTVFGAKMKNKNEISRITHKSFTDAILRRYKMKRDKIKRRIVWEEGY
jgi:hypothetical protein